MTNHPRTLVLSLALLTMACGRADEGAPGPAEEPGTAGEAAAESTGTLRNCTALPTVGLLATFDVGGSAFSTGITSPSGIDAAIAEWKGLTRGSFPIGKLSCEPVAWNCPWSFRLKPATVQLAQAAIELCDGTPALVDQACRAGQLYGAGTFCPWSATMTNLRDCRAPGCPVVPGHP